MTEKKDPVEVSIEKLQPILSKITFGSVMGYCSGVAMKQVGKFVAVVIGGLFIGLQSASHAGYIDVDWKKIKDDAVKKVDTTGDGKIDAEDVKVFWRKFKDILTANVPSSGGFCFGFLIGMKSD